MTTEILDKANALQRNIKDFQNALECFQYEIGDEHEKKIFDRKPRIIFEVDDSDEMPEQIKVPLYLNDQFVALLKKEIQQQLATTKNEFADLK